MAASGVTSADHFPTGTVTLLFTDIEGSTRMLQRLGDAYAQALGEHQALLRAAFAAHGGVEIDTQGDAFFVAFATAPQALAAAAAATRALAAHAWPQGTELRVRMGLHTGAPQLVGGHYIGLDVHRAARIAAAGHGGQILISEATHALTAQALPEAGASLRDLGSHRLKDLRQPEHLWQLILTDQPSEFPPLKTLDMHQHNLPVQPTALLDRKEPLAALVALLRRDDVRLVTLTGPGGIGKTRLSMQAASELIESFPDGVWFVRLSRLTEPNLVIPTIAQALGLQESGNQTFLELLQEYLDKKRLLLALDNFEQVMGAASEVATLLEAASGLKALVTSRAPLRLRGEQVYPLAPLPLAPSVRPGEPPPSVEQLTQYAAIALFIERARAVRSDFVVSAANAPAIGAICARLDGLPLAIELAAARVRLLPPEALLARLSSQLSLLSGGARDSEERQRTMQATLAWSEDLLSAEERKLFHRLAVFVGGCTLEVAEEVCATPAGAEPLNLDLLDGLSGLVDQSLVQQREEGGEARFGMLNVVREYALERLVASGEADALHRAHATAYLALAERVRPALRGPEAGAWMNLLELEHDNLRAALSWARGRGEVTLALRLATAISRFWMVRGHAREGRAWLEGLLAETPDASLAGAPTALRAQALFTLGALAVEQGEYSTAERALEQAAALSRAGGDLATAARALNALSMAVTPRGDLARARACLEESLAVGRELGDPAILASTLNNLSDVAVRQGDLEPAAAALAEALALARRANDRSALVSVLTNLGAIAELRGAFGEAAALEREALGIALEAGDSLGCVQLLEQMANTAGSAGQGERAARLLGAAAAQHEALSNFQHPAEQLDTERAVAAARAALGEQAWAAAFAAGHALSLSEAVAEALTFDG